MDKKFKGKTYLITGANSGMGKCVTNFLISEGANLFLVGRNDSFIKGVVSDSPNKIDYTCFDLSKPENIPALFNEAKSKGFKFDGLVYCAGISPLMALKDFDLEKTWLTYNINVISFIAMVRYFTDEDYSNANGSIVGISSNAAVYGGNRQYVYSSTKAAMNLVVKSCVKELALRKTRINTIMPSTTNTEMVAELRKQSDAIDLNVKYKQPFGIVEPNEVAKNILYLLSDDSSSISGIALPVNNGEVY